MNYKDRMKDVITYIGQHLDEDITLEQLSAIFYISKFHFHRLFTAYTGLSLQQYIKWLRMKRAAHQLITDKDQTIINIAINAGYDSHAAFSRAFKQACGMTPNQYRQAHNWSYWEKSPYCLPPESEVNMKVDIKKISPIRLAVIEHRGDPKYIADSVAKLITWSKAQAVSLKPKPGDAFAIAYDDPKTTPAEEFRIDFGIKIPANLTLSQPVIEKFLPEGRYAITLHKGSRDKLGDTVYPLYREWLPNSGEELGDLPCIFCYYNFDHEVAETELLTECWLLLK